MMKWTWRQARLRNVRPMTEALVGVVAVIIGIGLSVLVAVEGARLKDALAPLAFVGFGVVWILVMTNIRELRKTAPPDEKRD